MTIPAHPGHVLAGKLAAISVVPTEMAHLLHVQLNRITQIIQVKLGIANDSELQVADWFNDAPEFLMNHQAQHELSKGTLAVSRRIRSLPRHPAHAGVR